MEKLRVLIHDGKTGKTIDREMTDEELAMLEEARANAPALPTPDSPSSDPA